MKRFMTFLLAAGFACGAFGGMGCSGEKANSPEELLPEKTAEVTRDVAPADKKATLHFFYGKECEHCRRIDPEVSELARMYKGLDIKRYEVWYNAQNRDLLEQMAANKKRVEIPGKKTNLQGTPTIVIGDEFYVGSDMTAIKAMVVRNLKR